MIQISIEKMQPSVNLNPDILYEQFSFRLDGKDSDSHKIVIADIQEPVWWNRPLHSDTLTKLEKDGLYSYNLPFIGNRDNFKTGYNLLLNKNSIPIAVHIKLSSTWNAEILHKLEDMTIVSIYNALIALGVKPECLEHINNDLLYNGKKFVGGEHIIRNGMFTENLVLTLRYSEEKQIFDRLTGKLAQKRGITGIQEETELFTKEELLTELQHQLSTFISTYLS